MKTVKTKIFEYGNKEIDYLKSCDPVLGDEIEKTGIIEREIIPELFPALIYTIIGQQISVKASRTIWGRMQECFDEITPKIIAAASIEEIRKCGMQATKAGYIQGIASTIASGEFDLDSLYELSDLEAVKKLSSLHGIGVWTAESLLLNSMERPNIISYCDITIRRGIMKLYSIPELTREQFNTYKNRYSPYASVASLYLSKIAHE